MNEKDDLLENVEAAKQVGLDAILFESEAQLRTQLSQRINGQYRIIFRWLEQDAEDVKIIDYH